ncbi:MAG: S-methyl-5'-thioadenosine phosphorylase [Planctomycetota bacterium]|jgi:5'-methylthioadenosine phosphorylase
MAEELVGIIGGTGLGDALKGQIKNVEYCAVDTPFGKPSDKILVGTIGENRIAFINRHGEGHQFCPGKVPYAANIFAFKKLRVRTVIASGAVGSLREDIEPGHLAVVDQFIDKTYKRESTLFVNYGAVHCEMSEPCCSRIRQLLIESGKEINIKTHSKGTYVCMEGPQFSTRAESLMHRAWGGDLIGMTGMPEAKLAREAQMCYALVALVSDYDCWQPHEETTDKQTLLEEIIANLKKATENCLKLIKAVLKNKSLLICNDCSCRKSLELAVWTDQEKIDPILKEKFKILFE